MASFGRGATGPESDEQVNYLSGRSARPVCAQCTGCNDVDWPKLSYKSWAPRPSGIIGNHKKPQLFRTEKQQNRWTKLSNASHQLIVLGNIREVETRVLDHAKHITHGQGTGERDLLRVHICVYDEKSNIWRDCPSATYRLLRSLFAGYARIHGSQSGQQSFMLPVWGPDRTTRTCDLPDRLYRQMGMNWWLGPDRKI